VLDALAPTNFPWSNPTVLKELVDRGGANLVRGMRQLGRDLSRPPRLPASVDVSKFEVGGNLAVTPGAVVLRNEVLELIQYRPQTEQVRAVPLMLVPPTINKYYIMDLAPRRSIVEWLVGQGQQVFTISWRNPDPEQGHFDLGTYVEAVADAREAVAAVTGQESVHALGACSGGMITAGLLGSLAAAGRLSEFSSVTLMVCVLDNARAGTSAALGSRDLAAAAVAESARKGYLDGRALAEIFAWLRPNDLIWSYWVNNYLLGKDPPAFDVLFWNQDTVRMAAGLHRDFIKIALENPLARRGGLEVRGAQVDLSAVDIPAYVVAGLNDHIVPWENAYRTTQLLGGRSRFVLSTSGHIQAIVNPPSPESRSSYRTADENPPAAEEWMELADKRRGSWWPDYDRWLSERSGALKPAPARLGANGHRPAAKAPGSYVHAH
jgi:polyhydroxyalkanoate synthase